MGGAAGGRTALEIGCGRGVGVERVREIFGAARLGLTDALGGIWTRPSGVGRTLRRPALRVVDASVDRVVPTPEVVR